MPDVVRACVQSKEGDVKPNPTSLDCVCFQKAVIAYHARHYRPCVLSKGGDVMPRPTLPTVCSVQGGDVMPRLTSSNHACCPKAVMACHALCRSTVGAAQKR